MEIEASYGRALAYGFHAAAEQLLSSFGDYPAAERLSILQAVEFFERERDRLNTGIDWNDPNVW